MRDLVLVRVITNSPSILFGHKQLMRSSGFWFCFKLPILSSVPEADANLRCNLRLDKWSFMPRTGPSDGAIVSACHQYSEGWVS